ncbi:glyoxylate pathway regulator [Sclerotinia borealis F-4128]|uniref:Glyoxylate pathway regulator n=1 Tax=Sclerotinia borealis (strain F-4128) TaxID=1432307 RepID=W9BZS9_SCLBF|nr:glyoxylate pathway regulator [Sclerotinia borealis F-4128]
MASTTHHDQIRPQSHPNFHSHPQSHPLSHLHSTSSSSPSTTSPPTILYPPFAGALQPGLYRRPKKDLANPTPLGLSAFALSVFVLSLINWHTKDVSQPSIIISLSFGYGGLIQLLAGMWEMAAGNTFAATALSSYGGFWISLAIILTPGGFGIQASYDDPKHFSYAFGFFLMGWFIFTFLLWILTLRSTVVFSFLFFTVLLTFLFLGLAYLYPTAAAAPNLALQKAGGMTGLLAAFAAWYVVLAGLADDSNSFFTVPVWHFPWSEKGRELRKVSTSESLSDGGERGSVGSEVKVGEGGV